MSHVGKPDFVLFDAGIKKLPPINTSESRLRSGMSARSAAGRFIDITTRMRQASEALALELGITRTSPS